MLKNWPSVVFCLHGCVGYIYIIYINFDLSVVYQSRDKNTCLSKYSVSFFTKGWKCCSCERERDRQTDRQAKYSGCYIWHHIFLTHVLCSEPHEVLLQLHGWGPIPPVGGAQSDFYSDCPLLLTDHLSCERWNCVLI